MTMSYAKAALPQGAACPSCASPMEILHLQNTLGRPLELDLCFNCHGIWFDPRENTQLSAQSVLALFKALHDHNDQPHKALRTSMACPRCHRGLQRGEDRTVHGAYVVYRCTQQHGRFSTFSSFMLEKGFARQLSKVEVCALAEKVKVIHCNSCGAAVDLRKDHACPYCGAAFSLLDPKAVETALARYNNHPSLQFALEKENPQPGGAQSRRMAQASAELILAQERIKRENQRAELERKRQGRTMDDWVSEGEDELWSAGVEMVWKLLRGIFD